MATTDELAEICRSWSPYSLATFYEWVFAEQGWKLPAHFWPVCLALTDHRIHNLQLIIGPGVGKALHPDTLILLDTGWKKIKDVKVGEYVRTPNGDTSRIQAVMPQAVSQLWAFELEDGRKIISNDQHLWKARIHTLAGVSLPSIYTTEELRTFLAKGLYIDLPSVYKQWDLEWVLLKSVYKTGIEKSVCINIADPEGLFIAENYVVTHNSQMLSVIYPTWLIGHDPAMTILGISGGESLMQGFQQAAQRIIESSPAFLATFPSVRPDKNAGWSAERGLFVTGHPSGIPDANYLAAGMNSVYVTGKHSRTLIVDDLHNKENSATAEQCKKVRETYYNTILGRADPMGARIIVAGRRWSTEDIYGSLIESESFVTLRLPFIRDGEKQLYYDVYVPDDIECVFTDRKVHCGDGSIVSV